METFPCHLSSQTWSGGCGVYKRDFSDSVCDVAMMEDIVCVFSVNRLFLLCCCYSATARNATLHLCAFHSEVS